VPFAVPMRVIHSIAPIRVCDNGGWTDTWFSQRGQVFNIAVTPGAEVEIVAREEAQPGLLLNAVDYRDRYQLDLQAEGWGRHPLLEATIRQIGLPPGISAEISVSSRVPAGAATGTSAAVTVALIGALACLGGRQISPAEAASEAHLVETQLLGRQCGIQDQLCCAHGGINYIEMTAYPQATVHPIELPQDVYWELERRLLLILLGKAHDSSQMHQTVIRSLEAAGPDCPQLEDLRGTAKQARDAIGAADFDALGAAMIANTEAQARLHSAIVSADAARVIQIARACGARGWKVNGAGGDGGSLTLLCGPQAAQRRALVQQIESASVRYQNLPIQLSPTGLRVWETR